MAARDDVPWVPVPERLDRRLRLGPFPSGRDAAKFVAAAAVGAVVSLAVQPWAGLPIVALGAVVALWRPDGEGWDDRAVAVVRWMWRRSTRRSSMTPGTTRPGVGSRRTVLLPDGRAAAIVRTAGVPLTFLPPADVARQFDLTRELLRSAEGSLILVATSAPIHARAISPGELPVPDEERPARDGYRELVELLARRRSVRRVYVGVVQTTPGTEGRLRLEGAVGLLRERLAELGLRSERLVDRTLDDVARRLGWAPQDRGT